MKKQLVILVMLLSSFVNPVFSQGWQMVFKPLTQVTGYVYRDRTVYPATISGGNSFTAAVKAGKFPIFMTDPRTAPSGVKSRFGFDPTINEIYVKTAGDVDQLKFERKDGTFIIGSNADNPVLKTGEFYGAGPENSPPYNKQWKIRLAPVQGKIMKLTYKLTNGSTYVYEVIPPSMFVSNVQMFGTTSATPPPVTNPPIATGQKKYYRVFIVGNSITHHPGTQDWINYRIQNYGLSVSPDWGMDATTANKDYKHLLTEKFAAVNSTVQVREFADFPGSPAAGGIPLDLIDGPRWESDYYKLDNNPVFAGGLTRFKAIRDWGPDLIITRNGENITDNTQNLGYHYKQLINYLRSDNTAIPVVMTTSTWNQTGTDNIIRTTANELGASIVELEGVPGAQSGFAGHPIDAAMAVYADRIFDKVPNTTTVTTPPVTTPPSTGPPSGYTYNYPIPSNLNAAWPSFNTAQLSGSQIGEVARLENSEVLLEVRKRYGGAIQLTHKATGEKAFDWTDWGRQAERALYGGPRDFNVNPPGQNVNPGFDLIGWNPLTVGDVGGHGSEVVGWGYVTGNDNIPRIYVKTHMYSWPHNDSKALEAYNERWYGLNGKEVDVKTKATLFRSDKTFYEPIVASEEPTFMRPGKDNITYYYIGNNPYAGETPAQTNNLENGTTGFEQSSFLIGEPWVAMRQLSTVFLNTEKMGMFTTTVYNPQYNNSNDESNFQATYGASNNKYVLDHNGTYHLDYGFWVTGNSQAEFNEGRAWANARKRYYGNKPDFNFNVANGRNFWFVSHGYDQKEPFTSNGWDAVMVPSQDGGPLTARRSSLTSPIGIWKTSDVPDIYIKMQYSGQATQMNLSWRRNGYAEAPVNSGRPNQNSARYPFGYEGNSIQFNVINDGQPHTYKVTMSGHPHWSGIFQQLVIGYTDGNPLPQEGIKLLYVGYQNPQ